MKQSDIVQALTVAAVVGAAGWWLMRRQAAAAPAQRAPGPVAPLGTENPAAWESSAFWTRVSQPAGQWWDDIKLRQVEAGYSTGRKGM